MKNWKVLKGGRGWRLLTVNKKDLHIYERMLAADVRDTFSLRRNFLLLCEEDATHSPGFIPVNRHPFKVFWSYFAPRSAMSYWPHFVIAARGCSITSLFGTKCTQSAGRSIAKVADLHILPINMSSSGTSSWKGIFVKTWKVILFIRVSGLYCRQTAVGSDASLSSVTVIDTDHRWADSQHSAWAESQLAWDI